MKKLIDDTDNTLQSIIDKVKEVDGVDIELVHTNGSGGIRPEGLPPHYDNGFKVDGVFKYHMKWCMYSASVLDTNDYDGGEFVFLTDDDEVVAEYGKEEHYKKILIFSIDNKHMVRPTTRGDRIARLFFFKKIDP